MEQLEKFQDDRMKVFNEKLAKLDSNLTEMACYLDEKFYPYLLNTISGWRWLLTHGLKLFLVKYFNSALQELREVDFRLLAELKSHKDASTEDIMNVLCLEALVDVWTPLSEPLSVTSLMGEASTSSVVPTTSVTTTSLSTTFASASSIPPMSTDDYEIVESIHPACLSGVSQCVLGRQSYPHASKQKYPSYTGVDHTTCCGLPRWGVFSGPETNVHSSGINLLLFRVIISPSTGSFSIPHIISPLNSIKGVVAGTNWFLIFRRSRLKQCSYSISEVDPPSTYMRCMQWPPNSASMIIGPSVPSFSSRGGKRISMFLLSLSPWAVPFHCSV
nr:hypothetical protein [Tanacetum cinerariifolium]